MKALNHRVNVLLSFALILVCMVLVFNVLKTVFLQVSKELNLLLAIVATLPVFIILTAVLIIIIHALYKHFLRSLNFVLNDTSKFGLFLNVLLLTTILLLLIAVFYPAAIGLKVFKLASNIDVRLENCSLQLQGFIANRGVDLQNASLDIFIITPSPNQSNQSLLTNASLSMPNSSQSFKLGVINLDSFPKRSVKQINESFKYCLQPGSVADVKIVFKTIVNDKLVERTIAMKTLPSSQE